MSNDKLVLTREDLVAFTNEVAGAHTQREIAAALDVSQPSISQCLRDPEPRWDNLRIRLIEHLTSYRVEAKEVFVLTGGTAPEASG